MVNFDNKLMRIGVFYDGNYFFHVSNYYNYEHPRKARLSVSGLHDFIRHQVAKSENTDTRLCQVVDSHYFRGRLSSYEAEGQNKLLSERIFDDILMNEGVVTHYLPLKNREGRYEEKGIDVWLALEAFELSIYKKFNVVVLVASDGDYVPLIRKLNTLGIRVMVLAWDFEYADERTGKLKKTTTSIELLEEVTYPIPMQEVIENKVNRNDPVVNGLFVPKEVFPRMKQPQQQEPSDFKPMEQQPIVVVPTVTQHIVTPTPQVTTSTQSQVTMPTSVTQEIVTPTISHLPTATPITPILTSLETGIIRSTIHSLKNGYGFINYPPNNLFFHWRNLINTDFNELKEGDMVDFKIKRGEKGDDVACDVSLPQREGNAHYNSSFTLANTSLSLVYDDDEA